MNRQYISTKTQYDFGTLKNENNYKCDGSQCTCKYLHSRSDYDKQQFLNFQKQNDINYGENMFKSSKKRY